MSYRSIFSPSQILTLHRGLIHPCMECASHSHISTKHDEVKSFSLPLTDCLQCLNILCSVASLSVIYFYFHGYCSAELAYCMPPPSRGLAAQDFPLTLVPFLSIILMEVSISIFSLIPFTGKLWNSF